MFIYYKKTKDFPINIAKKKIPFNYKYNSTPTPISA